MKKSKTLTKALALLLSLCLCIPLTSCIGQVKKQSETYFDYLDTFCTITVYCKSKSFERYTEIFTSELERYHRLLDVYNSYDGVINLHTLNQNAGGEDIEVSNELFEFLQKAKEMHFLTNGYTSVSLGAVTSIWKDAIKNNTVPSNEALLEAAEHTDISLLVLDEQRKTVRLTDGQARLDAGAFAKGYVSDKISTALTEAGCESFLLNLGGNIYAHGVKTDGSQFIGAIENPLTQGTVSIITLNDRILSTSGSYNRGFDKDGIRYHHIIDPYTQKPQNTFVSVSVLCRSGIMADALSTALFSMSYEDGASLIDSLDGAEALWIFADGTIKNTQGITIN